MVRGVGTSAFTAVPVGLQLHGIYEAEAVDTGGEWPNTSRTSPPALGHKTHKRQELRPAL